MISKKKLPVTRSPHSTSDNVFDSRHVEISLIFFSSFSQKRFEFFVLDHVNNNNKNKNNRIAYNGFLIGLWRACTIVHNRYFF